MEQKVITQLKEVFKIKDQDILAEDKFRDYEGWDSMTSLSLLAMLHSEFDVVLNGADLKNLITIKDILTIVNSKNGK